MKDLFKIRPFLFLWLAQAVSGLGHTFAGFIISWLVFEMTGSKVAMGAIWIALMVPTIITQIVAGPYLDRWDRRMVMIVSEWMRAVVFLLPAILFPLGLLEVWHLYIVAIVIGIAEPLFRPSSMAYVAEILPKERLMKGNSILEGTMQTLMLFGPALGGMMVTLLGSGFVLTTLVVALSIGGILLFMIPRGEKKVTKEQSWIKQFKEGIGFFKLYPVLFWVGMMMMVINFTSGASQPMFLPFITEELGGTAFQYGLFTSAFSAGMVLGSLWSGSRPEPKNRRKVMLRALMINGALLFSLGWVNMYILAILIVLGKGFCAITFNINNTTFYQKRVPDHVRGRVFTVRMLMAQAGIPVGAAVGGILGDLWGLTILFSVLGGMILVVSSIAWFSPVFHRLNDVEDSEEVLLTTKEPVPRSKETDQKQATTV
jgi:MFS family permease